MVLNASLLVWDLSCRLAPDTYVMHMFLAAANDIQFRHHVNYHLKQ